MTEVIEDLSDHAAKDRALLATSGSTSLSVVCVAGRGSFDASVSAMIAQLLGQRGIAAQILPLGNLPREAIASLDLDGFETIVFSYLSPSSTPLRLIRRLRQRAPDARILVSPWPGGTPLSSDAAIASGPDSYCRSLHDLMETIVAKVRDDAVRERSQPAELA